MGTGKKEIKNKKITKELSRMVTFSKRRKGLFKKAEELHSKTGANVAIIVLSPAGRPYVYGDANLIDAALNACLNGTGSSSTSNGVNGATAAGKLK